MKGRDAVRQAEMQAMNQELCRLMAAGLSLTHPTVVRLSKQLDQYILEYYTNSKHEKNGDDD